MRRYLIWLISTGFALAAYAIAHFLGLAQLLVLLISFVGAVGGVIFVDKVMPARPTDEQAQPPRGRGSGRRGT